MAMQAEEQTTVYAMVDGKAITTIPADLFIPPDALEILLESFSGPLDILLYLIKKQNIDILDIPIAHITKQYMHYIHLMEYQRLELAADYLVMAAMLAEIKSRLLLPSHQENDAEEEDPRMQLVRKLQAYEQMKQAALLLDELPRCERDVYRVTLNVPAFEQPQNYPMVELQQLPELMQQLMVRQGHSVNHQVTREVLSVRQRMSQVLERLQQERMVTLSQLFTPLEGRMGLAVSFLAILELARQSLLIITQAGNFLPVHIMAAENG